MLIFPAKKIRAEVIADYVKAAGYRGVVAFSCGNATHELKRAGLFVVDISPDGDLSPSNKWWTPAEIRFAFPDLFDATSGHLPAHLMITIADKFKGYLGDIIDSEIPTGSGETITCLRWAYPSVNFKPIRGVSNATEYSHHAPLNYLFPCIKNDESGRVGGAYKNPTIGGK